MTLHQQRTHPTFVEGCRACHFSSLHINHTSEYKRITASEKVLDKNLDAYKRLRQEGRQPTLSNAYQLEQRAKTAIEIDHSQAPGITRLTESQQRDAMAAAQTIVGAP